MRKLVSAALIGSTAIALGVIPAASAFADTPTVPGTVSPSAPAAPGTGHDPGATMPGRHAPGHRAPGHRAPGSGSHRRDPGGATGGTTTGGHRGTGHRGASHGTGHGGHRTGTHTGRHPGATGTPGGSGTSGAAGKSGSGKSGSGRGKGGSGTGASGAGQPGSGGASGQPGTGKTVVHQPTKPTKPRRPVTSKPVVRQPVRHQPVTSAPVAPRPVGKPIVGKINGTPAKGEQSLSLIDPRIIGGTDATAAPWAAQIYWDDLGFQCSGSLIAPQWVLTAGHCVTDDDMSVRVGSLRLGGGTSIPVDAKQVDPVGDLALLHLSQSVKAEYAQLADADPQVGAVNQIFGWGKTSQDSGPARRLRTADVKVTALNCVDAKQGKAICSTGVDGSAYHGDSGGPEMANGVEVGVCSTGDDQDQTQQYASVAANRSWIRTTANV